MARYHRSHGFFQIEFDIYNIIIFTSPIMDSELIKLAKDTINDNNAELIRDFMLYLKSHAKVLPQTESKPSENFSLENVISTFIPRQGHEYNRQSIYHFSQNIDGYNGDEEFKSVLIDSFRSDIKRYICDTYTFNTTSGELVVERNYIRSLVYCLQDDGYFIRDEPGKYSDSIYKYDIAHVLQRIIYKKFGEKTNIFEVTKDSATVFHVEIMDEVKVKENLHKISECIQMIKDNKQLIDMFHLAPKFNKK
jgi:hypothetical protein